MLAPPPQVRTALPSLSLSRPTTAVMSSTTQFLRRLVLFILILNCLYPALVLGQDETTPAPDPPEPTTREAPPPTTREPPPEPTTREPPPPTTREPEPTTREPPTTRPDPTTRPEPTTTPEPTEPPTDPPTTFPPTTTPPATFPTTTVPTTTTQTTDTNTISTFTTTTGGFPTSTVTSTTSIIGSICQQECLTGAAGTLGCADTACICRQLESYINTVNTCIETNSCESPSQAIADLRRTCSNPPNTDTDTTKPGSTVVGPNTTPRNPPSPGPTVGTQGGTGVNGQLTTQTQTLVLTPGQVVTLPVSGTVRTTFTASSALTTTRIATMLEQAGFGGSGSDGSSGGAMGLHAGHGMSVVVAVVGVMVGAVFVL